MGNRCYIRKNAASPPPPGDGIFTSAAELASKPTTGTAWTSMKAAADSTPQVPDCSNQEDPENVKVLARALVYARLTGAPGGSSSYRTSVRNSCMQAIDTELGGRVLAAGREIGAYVIAADLVGLEPSEDTLFRAWLNRVKTETLSGETFITIDEHKPNNWRGHASFTRIAIARYTGDATLTARCAQIQEGWVGNRAVYAFNESDWLDGGTISLEWHADQANKRGINALGSTIEGHDVDGLLPDDQRRPPNDNGFEWPPSRVNYVYECLQGIICSAVVLDRAGYDVWNWQNQGILRAFKWLERTQFVDQVGYPAEGDDKFQPWVINHFYPGANLAASSPAGSGKNFGWTDWIYGPDA